MVECSVVDQPPRILQVLHNGLVRILRECGGVRGGGSGGVRSVDVGVYQYLDISNLRRVPGYGHMCSHMCNHAY